MSDDTVMINVSQSSSRTAHGPQTNRLTPHRYAQLPSYAMHAGGPKMPPAWQTRNAPFHQDPRQDGPTRSFADIALDPWRFMTATTPRKIAFAMTALVLSVMVIF